MRLTHELTEREREIEKPEYHVKMKTEDEKKREQKVFLLILQ